MMVPECEGGWRTLHRATSAASSGGSELLALLRPSNQYGRNWAGCRSGCRRRNKFLTRIGLPMGHRNFPPRLGLVSRGAPVNPVEDVRDLGEALGLRIEPGVGCQPVHPVDR
jgi:hypothetical protein